MSLGCNFLASRGRITPATMRLSGGNELEILGGEQFEMLANSDPHLGAK
jgi:hypothetical protein